MLPSSSSPSHRLEAYAAFSSCLINSGHEPPLGSSLFHHTSLRASTPNGSAQKPMAGPSSYSTSSLTKRVLEQADGRRNYELWEEVGLRTEVISAMAKSSANEMQGQVKEEQVKQLEKIRSQLLLVWTTLDVLQQKYEEGIIIQSPPKRRRKPKEELLHSFPHDGPRIPSSQPHQNTGMNSPTVSSSSSTAGGKYSVQSRHRQDFNYYYIHGLPQGKSHSLSHWHPYQKGNSNSLQRDLFQDNHSQTSQLSQTPIKSQQGNNYVNEQLQQELNFRSQREGINDQGNVKTDSLHTESPPSGLCSSSPNSISAPSSPLALPFFSPVGSPVSISTPSSPPSGNQSTLQSNPSSLLDGLSKVPEEQMKEILPESHEEKAQKRCLTVCVQCGATETPEWRMQRTLCNACGLRRARKKTREKKEQQKRTKEKASIAAILNYDLMTSK